MLFTAVDTKYVNRMVSSRPAIPILGKEGLEKNIKCEEGSNHIQTSIMTGEGLTDYGIMKPTLFLVN